MSDIWLTCAECSSLGLDKAAWYGEQKIPKSGICSSCGGPWPRRPERSLDDVVTEMRDEILGKARDKGD